MKVSRIWQTTSSNSCGLRWGRSPVCSHNPRRDFFYSVYTNKRICRYCWTEEKLEEAFDKLEEEQKR